jgi:hypothetical protein
MTWKTWITRSAGTAVVLTVAQAIAGSVLLPDVKVPGAFPWAVAANGIAALLVTYLASRLTLRAWPRAAVLFLVLFGIPANNLVEVIFFDVGVDQATLPRLFILDFLVAAVLAGFVSWLTRMPSSDRGRTFGPAPLAARIAGGSAAYVLVYFAAGLVAIRFLADFYAGRTPELGTVILVQLFRGAVLSGIAAAIVACTAAAPLRSVALTVGLTFSILGGIVPLIPPNAFLPTPVRLVHLVEVGVSNLLYGCFVGWLFVRAAAAHEARGRADLVPA